MNIKHIQPGDWVRALPEFRTSYEPNKVSDWVVRRRPVRVHEVIGERVVVVDDGGDGRPYAPVRPDLLEPAETPPSTLSSPTRTSLKGMNVGERVRAIGRYDQGFAVHTKAPWTYKPRSVRLHAIIGGWFVIVDNEGDRLPYAPIKPTNVEPA